MVHLDRRTFLLGAAGVAGLAGSGLLAACGSDDGGGPRFLLPTAPDGFNGPSPLVHGVEQRIAYGILEDTAPMRADAPDEVEIGVFFEGEQIGGGLVRRRNTGPDSMPTFEMAAYYPVIFTPPAAGIHVARLLDQDEPTEHQFLVGEPGQTAIPQPGDRLPAVHTATTDDLRGIADLCTRTVDCPFHTVDLATALDSGDRPIVLSIATPGFCQTATCGPVIELLIEAAADRDDLHVVHAEVFVDAQADVDAGTFPAGPTSDIVAAFDLPFEPMLVVARADGTVVRRLDGTYDRSELVETLALV